MQSWRHSRESGVGEHTLLMHVESEPLYSISPRMRLFGAPRSALSTRKGCRALASESLAARTVTTFQQLQASTLNSNNAFNRTAPHQETAGRRDKCKRLIRLSIPRSEDKYSRFTVSGHEPRAFCRADACRSYMGHLSADADENDRRPTPAQTRQTLLPCATSKHQCARALKIGAAIGNVRPQSPTLVLAQHDISSVTATTASPSASTGPTNAVPPHGKILHVKRRLGPGGHGNYTCCVGYQWSDVVWRVIAGLVNIEF